MTTSVPTQSPAKARGWLADWHAGEGVTDMAILEKSMRDTAWEMGSWSWMSVSFVEVLPA
jgi:hypothetical protein